MSERTKYQVRATDSGSVFVRFQEGPREWKLHLSPNQARDLAAKISFEVVRLEILEREKTP